MTQDELDALAAEHGGITGRTAIGPAKESDPDTNGYTDRAIPDERRQTKIVFKDGSYLTVQKADPESNGGQDYNVVSSLSKAPKDKSGDAPPTRLDGQGNLLTWNKDSGTWEAVGNAESRVSPEEAESRRQKAIEDLRERVYNRDNGNGYLSHAEVAALKRQQTADNLNEQQLQLAKDRLSKENERLDAQLERDKTNDARADRREDRADTREERLTSAAELQAQAQKSAQDLATKKLDWDKKVKAGEMEAEDAWREYQKEWNDVQAKASAARLQLDKEIAQADKDSKARADETTRRGQDLSDSRGKETAADARTRDEETRRHDQETEEQSRYNTAADIGQAAAKTATDSLPFMAPTGTAADLAATRNGMLSDPQHPTPMGPGRSVPFPWDPTTLVHNLTAKALAQFSPTARAALTSSNAPPPPPPAPVLTPQGAYQTDEQVRRPSDRFMADAGASPNGQTDAWWAAHGGKPAPAAAAKPAASSTTTTKAPNTVINLTFAAPMGSPEMAPQQMSDSNTDPRQRGLLGG